MLADINDREIAEQTDSLISQAGSRRHEDSDGFDEGSDEDRPDYVARIQKDQVAQL